VLSVNGVSGTILDLDLGLDITHYHVGDLVITLRHMDTGTAVTLVDRMYPRSPYYCAADHFDDVTLSDEALNPIEMSCTSPLTGYYKPNNSLSAFDGENPNGTWVLNVSDHRYGSPGAGNGTINWWGIRFSTATCATATSTPIPSGCSTNLTSSDVPKPIPDNNTSGVDSTITVSGISGTILDLDLINLFINHDRVGDLVITLKHVDTGTAVTLVDRMGYPLGNPCIAYDFYNVVLDDGAPHAIEYYCGQAPISGSYKPNNPLSAFNGENPNGTWTLNVSDRFATVTGALDLWSLKFWTMCP
jgi:subtilisin-like proprotein convertase family protein